MAAQELFNIASENYQKARQLVGKMNEVVSAVRSDFNPKAGYLKLDIIVQYTLLEVALADGKFSPIEGEFIDKITDTFDVINLFDNVPKGMNWRWFADNKGFNEIKNTIGNLRKMAQEHMMDFAALFSLVDAAYPDYDILAELLEYLGLIAGAFTRIDGSHDESEVKVASAVTEQYLVRPWIEMMRRARNSK